MMMLSASRPVSIPLSSACLRMLRLFYHHVIKFGECQIVFKPSNAACRHCAYLYGWQ